MNTKILQDCELFQYLNSQQLDLFKNSIKESKLKKGEVVFSQGDTDNSLFILIDGQVSIRFILHVNTGEIRPIINKIDKGNFFGEFALIDAQPRTATAIALEDSVLWRITKEDFDKVLEDNKEVGYIIVKNLLKILIQRIRQTDQQLQGALLIGWNAYKFDKLDEK
ncbi:MAG: cyclic nucleotide-binding domain-containing protein [Candidatus Margulisbacteria bacterium]|nr:cyclic nucleotide-binding domain-containing protein [Candidatus Margulisiibacteriota bacterium]